MNWITLPKLAEDFGSTQESLRALIKKGRLQEGIHWKKSPHGRIIFNVDAFERWLLSNPPTTH